MTNGSIQNNQGQETRKLVYSLRKIKAVSFLIYEFRVEELACNRGSLKVCWLGGWIN